MTEDQISDTLVIMRQYAPALKKVADDNLTIWIMTAAMFVCQSRFGADYLMGVALMGLHLMFLDGAMKGESESVTAYSQRVASFSLTGEFSQSFDRVSADQSGNLLMQTPFGKMFNMLNRKKGGGFGLITAAHRC